MTFTTNPPTTPGFYAWKWHEIDEPTARYLSQEIIDAVCSFYGYWCRLVPAEEVEKAYREGAHHSMLLQAEIDYEWNHSRARQVAEGKL